MSTTDSGEVLAAKFAVVLPHLDGRQRRLLLGAEARSLGRGGIARVAAAAGVSRLSEEVLTAHLRDAIAQVPAAAPSRIHVHADGNHNYTGITIEITVQYPEAIIPIADEIREHTQQVLHQLLGTEIPTVTINTMHVHVSDITTNDPHTGQPPKPSGAERKP